MAKNTKKQTEEQVDNQTLLDQISQLEQERDSAVEKHQRALADYQNLEKRTEAHQQQFVKFANATLIQKLLEVRDNLVRTAKHLQDQAVEMVINQFDMVLESQGVIEIAADSQEFDAILMECIETREGEDNQVLEVVEAGFMLHETVLRPAKVIVGKSK